MDSFSIATTTKFKENCTRIQNLHLLSSFCNSARSADSLMKTLATSPSFSKIALQRNGNSRDFNLTRHGIGFFSSKKLLHVGFLISVKRKTFQPISASTPSSLSKPGLEDAETKTQEKYQSKTVHVKFQLKKECSFGEQFVLVGDDPLFGMWDPANAIPLKWSDGHVWTVELDIPIGKSIQFKFILKEVTGRILWQPGPDRIFKAWETENTIVVSEDWEDDNFQELLEEETIYNNKVEPVVNSEMLDLAENLTHQIEELASEVNFYPPKEPLTQAPEEPTIADSIPSPELEPVVIVADNISYITEDPVVRASHQVLDDFESNHEKDGNEAISNKEAMAAEEVVGNNGSFPTEMITVNMNMEGNLVTHEGDPVLVPGLPLLSSESVIQDEVETSSGLDASVGVTEVETSSGFDASVGAMDEVKNHNLPEVTA
ncbi:uncharacterized protein LOC110622059 isoform X2 [Manihot esculenta]|uniref:uncharacterized protein LOC110622059 isoform X2 n=1 Tax=Manihot esculenta TaxID=3983 RepID=UPI000B5D53AE|nr:uncharacterized protein LOC110622059 isoform X2 [Manihot esculenta]